MDVRRRTGLLLALTVPVSSLLGLARPMKQAGAKTFADVWSANVWGDLVFTLGTLAAGWLVARLVLRWSPRLGWRSLLAAAPVAFVLHWLVYATSWTLTGNVFLSDPPQPWAFRLDGLVDAWEFTWRWGALGLVAMALASPLLGWLDRPLAAQASPPETSGEGPATEVSEGPELRA